MAISKIASAGVATDTLTATDIADDAIGTAELANDVVVSTSVNITTTGALAVTGASSLTSVKQTDAQNLSGTYSTHEIIMGKTFTATGDLTVNTNLVLVNMCGTGDDVTILDDGTATTITGTGTLEGGEMLGNTPQRTSLTGMTGALGSVVTGSPALNLGNATGVLPAGVTGGSGLDVITVTDQWLINSARTSGTINGDWVRPSSKPTPGYGVGWGNKGGGINDPNSSGHFSFKVTGLYLIFMTVIIREQTGGADANSGIALYVSDDNGGDFNKTIIARTHASTSPDGTNASASNMGFINVNAITGGSTVKFLVASDSLAGDNELYGDTSTINTNFSIIRLGNAE